LDAEFRDRLMLMTAEQGGKGPISKCFVRLLIRQFAIAILWAANAEARNIGGASEFPL